MTELGILTGLTRGEATVTVADSATSLTGTAKVTVVGGVLKALEIAGAPLVRDKPSGTRVPPNVLPLGLSANFIATALYADAAGKVFLREDVTDHAVWSSSHPKVASVSTGGSTRGVVDALAVGATNIKAAFGGLDSKAFALTVAKVPPTSLVIVPSSLALPVGEMSHFLARATYAVATAGKTAGKPTAATFDVTAVVAWRSSDKTVASVSNAPGLSGQVRAIATGTATITASLVDDGASTHATVTVTPAAMSALAITPALRVLGIGERVQYRARATYSDGTMKDVTNAVFWSSNDPTIAHVSDTTPKGLVLALGVGVTTLSAVDAKTGTVATPITLTVVTRTLVSIAIDPALPTIADGLEVQFRAMGTYSDQRTADLTADVLWSVPAGTATISNGTGTHGLATSHGAGTSVIHAEDPETGVSATTTLTVTPAALVSISVSPSSATIMAGTTQAFTATGTYTDGTTQDLTAVVGWTASGECLGQTELPGVFLGNAACTSIVTATDAASGISATATLTVTAVVLTSIVVAPANLTLNVGTSVNMAAGATYSDLTQRDVTLATTWASSAPDIVSVSSVGLATALLQGSATITATDPTTGISGATTVTAVPPVASYPLTLTFLPTVECCGACGEPFSVTVQTIDSDGGIIGSLTVDNADIVDAGQLTVTFPAPVSAGEPIKFGISTPLSVYSCSVSAGIGDGLVTGPVTATVSCYRNNC